MLKGSFKKKVNYIVFISVVNIMFPEIFSTNYSILRLNEFTMCVRNPFVSICIQIFKSDILQNIVQREDSVLLSCIVGGRDHCGGAH